MNFLFWGLTIGVIGKLMLAVGVLLAHSEILNEKMIDNKVLMRFRTERVLALIGIVLILIGYIMEVYFYGFTPFLTCFGSECTAAVQSALTAPQ